MTTSTASLCFSNTFTFLSHSPFGNINSLVNCRDTTMHAVDVGVALVWLSLVSRPLPRFYLVALPWRKNTATRKTLGGGLGTRLGVLLCKMSHGHGGLLSVWIVEIEP